MRSLSFFLMLLIIAGTATAFNEPSDEAGPLKAVLNVPDTMTDKAETLSCSLQLHCGDAPVEGEFLLSSIDGWQIHPEEKQSFALNPGESREFPFSLTAAPDSFNAIYPVHAHIDCRSGEDAHELHPVQLIYTHFEEVPQPDSTIPWKAILLKNRKTALLAIPVHRIRVAVLNKEAYTLPVGFSGADRATRAEIVPYGAKSLPDTHDTLFAHPPWQGGIRGSVSREYYLQLPQSDVISFHTAIAIARHQEGVEPPSDGVTFRVRLLKDEQADQSDDTGGIILAEKHTKSFTWEELSCDLSPWVGETISLLLEAHPGPDLDTTCDRALWGDPHIIIGDAEEKKEPITAEKYDLGTIQIDGHGTQVFFQPGSRGLLDGTLTFAGEKSELSFEGFSAKVFGEELKEDLGVTTLRSLTIEEKEQHLVIRHIFENTLGSYDLVSELSLLDGKALRVELRIENAPPVKPWLLCYLEEVATGPWSSKATRVYAGMGNVICEPEAFTLEPDGHQLATSFVGFDFESGLSLVQALQAPPSRFKVAPQDHIYTLEAGVVADYHFLPATDVWSALRAWREINGLQPGPGVETLAGRFTFDLWGGHYAPAAEALKKSFQYGLTKSVVVWHSWQHHGYDYRLPDITPANPRLGTLEEFQDLANLCKEKGVLFSPHDNYIDFYPDADNFTYDHIAFHKNREPVWAWLNEGRGAQAFRWRPTAYQPFMQKNLHWLKDNISPDAFFIDVWTSLMPYDQWTQDGYLEDRMLCRKMWQESFQWIQNLLGHKAPMISESGHDQLIGFVDGAQANHLRVDADPPAGRNWGSTWRIECADAQRVPWSDMAYHDRFVYQGAGYDPRYRAGWRADLHGIYSDDYISTEMLTGHAAMTPSAFSRDGVRKYWLSNDFINAIALNPMATHDFVGNDIHRQQVTYENGARVLVNRGATPWTVEGHTLPSFGFYAEAGDTACAIEEREGTIVEWSRSPESFYVNARVEPEACPSVRLLSSQISSGKDMTLQLSLEWEFKEQVDERLRVFVHFVDKEGDIVFQADHPFPAEKERTTPSFTTTVQRAIPQSYKAGDQLEVHVGIFEPEKRRLLLQQAKRPERYILAGTLSSECQGDTVTSLSYESTTPETDPYFERVNVTRKPVAFDGVLTDGAFRMTLEKEKILLMPLPESPAFTVELDLDALPFTVNTPDKVIMEKSDGTSKEEILQKKGRKVLLSVPADTFVLCLE